MLNPMKLKDYVTMGNVLSGVASMVSVVEGDLDWACYFMVIAWVFDSFDGAVAKLTGGGNKFGEVLDNVADLVSYSLAPTFVIYLAYRSPQAEGGAGWPLVAAAALASIPTAFGCVRFARNNVKDIILPRYHLGLPRTVYALCLVTLFTSHLFRGPWMSDPDSWLNPFLYGAGAVFILVLSFLMMTLRPYYARPKKGASRWLVFCTTWFLSWSALGLITGLALGMPRIFMDTLFVNFTLYTWLQHLTIPKSERKEIKEYLDRLVREWKQEMG